jgi:hypothetical protein
VRNAIDGHAAQDDHGIIIPRRFLFTAPMPVGVRVLAESLEMKLANRPKGAGWETLYQSMTVGDTVKAVRLGNHDSSIGQIADETTTFIRIIKPKSDRDSDDYYRYGEWWPKHSRKTEIVMLTNSNSA